MKILVGSIKGHQTLNYKSVFFYSICQNKTMVNNSMPVYVGRLIIHTFVHFPMISQNFFTIYKVEIESKCDIFLVSSTSVTVYYHVNTMSVKYSKSTEDKDLR